MAKGDVVSGISTVANGANLDYQPAAGVEALIKSAFFSSSGYTTYFSTGISFGLWNGSYHAHNKLQNPAYTTSELVGDDSMADISILINNSIYLRIHNATGSSCELGYTGIQTK